MTKHLIALLQICRADPFTQKGFTVSKRVGFKSGQMQHRGPEIDETDKAISATAALVIDQMRKILWNAHHQGHM